jgi:antitoxin component of MazEF toxin-antitoxin module
MTPLFRRVGKTGHSLCITIPPWLATQLELRRRDMVALLVVDNELRVRKVTDKQLGAVFKDVQPAPTRGRKRKA